MTLEAARVNGICAMHKQQGSSFSSLFFFSPFFAVEKGAVPVGQ
jgi:hypothetical protein